VTRTRLEERAVSVEEMTAVPGRPSLCAEEGCGQLRFPVLQYSLTRKRKNCCQTLGTYGIWGGGIVSLYVGRNEMSLEGHKNRKLFRGVVGQTFF
jgi:hypothetical protein